MSKRTREEFDFELQISETENPEAPNVDAASSKSARKGDAEGAAMAGPAEKGNIVYEMGAGKPRLSLTLVAQPCILDGLTLFEEINENLLDQLIHSDLLLEDFGTAGRGPLMNDIFKNEKNQLIKFKNQTHRKGLAHVTYKKQDGNPFGRSNPVGGIGLHNMRRALRHTLAENIYVDIDMKNAHPSILLQVLKDNGIPCPCLEEYVDNREEALADVMEYFGIIRDSAKNLFLLLMYLGTFEKWAQDNNITKPIMHWIERFVEELRGIAGLICEMNPEIVERTKNRKAKRGITRFNLGGSVLSTFCQEYECQSLEAVYLCLLKSKRIPNNVAVLCADGIMIEKRFSTPGLLDELTQAVRTHVGLDLEFTIKNLDEAYKNVPDHIVFDLHRTGFNTGNVATLFKMWRGDQFMQVNGRMYHFNGTYWESEAQPFAHIHNYVDQDFSNYIKRCVLDNIAACEKRIEAKVAQAEIDAARPTGAVIEITPDAPTVAVHLVQTRLLAPPPVPSVVPSRGTLPHANRSKQDVAAEKVQLAADKAAQRAAEKVQVAAEKAAEKVALAAEKAAEKALADEKAAAYAADPDVQDRELLFDILTKYLPELRSFKARKNYIDDIQSKITDNSVQFDTNPFLFAFTDKVFDLALNKFQDVPDPRDLVSLTSGYAHNPNPNPNLRKELLTVICQILPEPETRNYYLTILSTGLCGAQLPNLVIANGEGGNGKSVLDSLALQTVGHYGYSMPSTCLTTPMAEGANPAIANLHNKRLCIAAEPPEGKKICTSVPKVLTGNAIVPARKLYSNENETKMCVTLVIECNSMPILDVVDVAMQRRIRVIPFESKFLSEEEFIRFQGYPNVHRQDAKCNLLEFRIEYRQEFWQLLLEFYAKFHANNCLLPSQPANCAVLTRDFLVASDDMFDWFTSKYESTPASVKSVICLKDIYFEFENSKFYADMTKIEKRQFCQKNFLKKCESNIFMKQHIRRRDQRVNGKQLKKDSVVGWDLKVEKKEPEEKDDDECDV